MSIEFESLHQVLRNLFTEMFPMCGNMIGVAKGIAGFGALFYVSSRVWQAIARAEAIDVYPLLRPFAIGLCIMFFQTFVIDTLSLVLSPVVKGTNQMMETQVMDMNEFKIKRDQKEYEAMKRNPETAFLVDDEEYERRMDKLGIRQTPEIITLWGERKIYQMKQSVRNWFKELLELIFHAVALAIDTIRTFFLLVLAILGPLAFALSIYDGFQSTLTQWLARYISIYLWLPISDLFSCILAKIQTLVYQKEFAQFDDPSFIPDGSGGIYIVFLIIGILGYFTIPTVASWIVQSGGSGSYGSAINRTAMAGGALAGAAGGAIAGRALNTGGRLVGRGMRASGSAVKKGFSAIAAKLKKKKGGEEGSEEAEE